MYYINIFFLFSLLGHVIENFVYTEVDSGILYGIWTPIYGIGTLTILGVNRYLDRFHFKIYLKIPLLFVLSAIVLATIETIGGYYIEIVFGRIFWSYGNHFLPIGKYTSLQMMGLWGISSIGLVYILLPLVDKWIKKVPPYLTYTLIGLFLTDVLYTHFQLANFFNSVFIVLIHFFKIY